MATSPQFHHGDLKNALFEAAVELLDQHAAEGVTIRAVARATGVSHSAPVNHYRDRRALLTAIAQRQFETILASIETALAQHPNDPKARIRIFAQTLMDFGFAFPHRYQLLWRSDLVDHEDPALLTVMDRVYDQLCAEIANTTKTAAVDNETVAVAMWSMVHGYVDMRLSGMFVPLNDQLSGQARREAIMDLFMTCLHP